MKSLQIIEGYFAKVLASQILETVISLIKLTATKRYKCKIAPIGFGKMSNARRC